MMAEVQLHWYAVTMQQDNLVKAVQLRAESHGHAIKAAREQNEGWKSLSAHQMDMTVKVPAGAYGEGYWERGEGSNYHGYGDDPGWHPIATILRMHLPAGGTLVELGCASGYFVRAARRFGIKAVGVDLSEYAIAQAPEDVKPYVNVASATDITDTEPGRLDGVVSWEMLEHLTPVQIRDTIEGIWDALKPGGLMWHKIALDTDHRDGYEDIPYHDAHGDVTHVSLWLPEEWRALFEDRGFVRSPGAEDMLNSTFRNRDWYRRFFCYRKPSA